MIFSLNKAERNFIKYRESETAEHELRYLFWECTLRCNLNCLHCGSDCLKQSAIPDMDSKDFIQVLKDIKKRWPEKKLTVCITGGEPLLRPDIEDVGKEIVSLGFQWGLVTNGLLMTPERFVSLMNAGMTSISFSLDGFENEHNWLRQNPASFEKVVQAIKTAVALKKLDSERLVFDTITCVHKNNLSSLGRLKDFLIDLGVEHWRIFSIFPEGRASQNDLSLSKEEYIELLDFIKSTRAEGKIHLNYACEGYLGDYEKKVRDYNYFCRGGINVASVMSNGDVGACLSVRNPAFIQGNIYETPFPDLWEQKFSNMRNREWTKVGKCAKCKKYKSCLGNGLHLHKDDCSEPSRCNFELT